MKMSKTLMKVGGVGLIKALTGGDVFAQTDPESAHIIWGRITDKGVYVADSTELVGMYGDLRVDNPKTNKVFGESDGYPGSHNIEIKTDNPSTPALEGVPRGDTMSIYLMRPDSSLHRLNYVVDGDTVHTIEHKSGFSEIDFHTEEKRPTGVGDSELEFSKGMKLYPNPTDGMIELDVGEGNGRYVEAIKIFGTDGRLYEYDMNGMNGDIYSLKVGDLPSGCYIMSVQNKNGEFISRKFIKR